MTPQVKTVCKQAGISELDLKDMARLSAPYTHRWANRRWRFWIFKIEVPSGTVLRLARADSAPPIGFDVMYDECDLCDGGGCAECGWHGEVATFLDKRKTF